MVIGGSGEVRTLLPKKGQQKKSSKTPFGDIIRRRGAMFLTLSRNMDGHPRHAMAPTWRIFF
jgi:hypothetical protein